MALKAMCWNVNGEMVRSGVSELTPSQMTASTSESSKTALVLVVRIDYTGRGLYEDSQRILYGNVVAFRLQHVFFV